MLAQHSYRTGEAAKSDVFSRIKKVLPAPSPALDSLGNRRRSTGVLRKGRRRERSCRSQGDNERKRCKNSVSPWLEVKTFAKGLFLSELEHLRLEQGHINVRNLTEAYLHK